MKARLMPSELGIEKAAKMAKYEGAGGYGTTSTLNTDSRQGRYFPHKDIFILKQHPFKIIRCFTCKAQWEDGQEFPKTCKKQDDWQSAEEILK